MNVKPGDLAMYVGLSDKARGMVTLVVGPSGIGEGWWAIDPPLPDASGNTYENAADWALRPIRDNDEPDQTMEWAGKPQEVTA